MRIESFESVKVNALLRPPPVQRCGRRVRAGIALQAPRRDLTRLATASAIKKAGAPGRKVSEIHRDEGGMEMPRCSQSYQGKLPREKLEEKFCTCESVWCFVVVFWVI